MSLAETWHKIEGWGEEHPVALAAIVFVFGAIILYMILPRGGGTGQAGPSDAYYNAQAAMAASGNQLQAAQIAAQAHAADTQAQLTAANNQIAGQIALATIDSQTQLGVAGISADYQTAHDKIVAQSTDLASTLTAQVQTAGINAQQNIAALNASAATQAAQIASNTQLGLASYQAQTAEASYQSQAQSYAALMGAQSHIADLTAEVQRYQAYNAIASQQLVLSTLPALVQHG